MWKDSFEGVVMSVFRLNSCPLFSKITIIKILSSKVILKILWYFSDVKHVNFMDVIECINNSVHGTFTITYEKIKVLDEICPLCLTTLKVSLVTKIFQGPLVRSYHKTISIKMMSP